MNGEEETTLFLPGEIQLINVEGMMEIENDHQANSTVITVGKPHSRLLKLVGGKYHEKQDVCVVSVSPHEIRVSYKGENSNFTLEKPQSLGQVVKLKVPQ